jgi:CubicO group peptidase (beta-lactamase class C family)
MPGFDRLHAAMAARVANHELPGLVMLVARGDEVHVDAIGTTAFEGGEPMLRDTPFRIASMTKPVLATATMLLVEDGTLNLDAPVDRWLPELANPRVLRRIDGPLDDTVPAQRPVTLDDLLTQRLGSGILFEPTYNPPYPIVEAAKSLQLVLSEPDPRTPHSPDAWIKLFGSLPLMCQPSERWLYNVGTLVLGVLVARAAAQPLPDLLQARIFDPLGMRTTGFWLPAEITGRLPTYYFGGAPQSVSTPEEWSRPPAFPSGSGGLLSTVDDFLAFARMLLNRGAPLLSERSVDLMTHNQLTPEQIAAAGPVLSGRGWGFGVGVVTQPDAHWPVRLVRRLRHRLVQRPAPRRHRHGHDPGQRLPVERRPRRVRAAGGRWLTGKPCGRLLSACPRPASNHAAGWCATSCLPGSARCAKRTCWRSGRPRPTDRSWPPGWSTSA